jgi:hypothetical protein
MSSTLLRPLHFSEILDGAFTLYRRYFATFFVTALVCFLPMPLVSLLIPQMEAGSGAATAGALVLVPVMLFALMIGWGALTWQTAQGINQRPLSFGEGMRRGIGSFFRLTVAAFVGYLLVGTGVMVLALVIGLVAALLFDGGGGLATAMVAVGFVAGMLFFLGAFAALFAIPPAVVVEGRGPLAALKRSWQLTRGAWLRVVGLVVVSWLIVMLPTIGLYAVGAGTGMFSLSPDAAPATAWPLIEASMSFLISALTYPFFVAATTLLYFDRRVRAEAYDLQVATESLALTH